MKKYLFLLICLFMIPLSIKADGLNISGNETIDEQKEVDGSSILFGNNITSNNVVEGIEILFGNNVTFNGNSDYAFLFGNNIEFKGNINNDGFIFGNVIKFDKDTVINRDLIVFGSDVVIDGKISRDITIYAMNVSINGEVSGNVNVKTNEIKVNGNIAGTLSYNEDAAIEITGNVNETQKTEKLVSETTFQDKVWNFIVNYGGTLVIFLALSLLFPQLFKRVENKNKNISVLNAFSLFGFGALSIILIPVLFIILLSLVFCLPLSILLLITYIVSIWLSSIFTSYLLGNIIWKKIIKKEENIYLIGLVGISIITVFSTIPKIGFLFSVVSIFVGMGLILQQLKKDN